MKKLISLFIIAGAFVVLAGCNTMDGVGRDMESAGDSVQDAAN